jgi:hypothetical protein
MMFPVVSSWIDAICFVDGVGLQVRYKKRDGSFFTCTYPQTTNDHFERMLVSPSKGRHIWQHYYLGWPYDERIRELDCSGGTVTLPCCPNPLPLTLHAVVPVNSGCACLDGIDVPLTYDPGSQTWKGNQVVCDSEIIDLEFSCGTTGCFDATLVVSLENHGTVGPVTTQGCLCSPLFTAFDDIVFPTQGSECNGPISIVVIE